MKEKRKYSVKKLLAFVNDIEEILGGAGVIDYIAVTPDEFSIYIQHGVSMLLVMKLINLGMYSLLIQFSSMKIILN